jgi:hypothetical protein
MSMDFQDAPDIIFDKKWKKTQRKISKIVKEYDDKIRKKIESLKKVGYSNEEIDEYFCV